MGGTRWGRSPPRCAPLHSKAAASICPRAPPGAGTPRLGRLQGGGGSCCSPLHRPKPNRAGGEGLPTDTGVGPRRLVAGDGKSQGARPATPALPPRSGGGERDPPAQSPGVPALYAMTNSDFISALTSGFQTESSKSRSRLPSLETLLLLLVRPALRLGTQWYGALASLRAFRRSRFCCSSSCSRSTLQRVARFSVCRSRSPAREKGKRGHGGLPCNAMGGTRQPPGSPAWHGRVGIPVTGRVCPAVEKEGVMVGFPDPQLGGHNPPGSPPWHRHMDTPIAGALRQEKVRGLREGGLAHILGGHGVPHGTVPWTSQKQGVHHSTRLVPSGLQAFFGVLSPHHNTSSIPLDG